MSSEPNRTAMLRRLENALAGRSRKPLPAAWEPSSEMSLTWDDFEEAIVEAHGEFHEAVDLSSLRDTVEVLMGETLDSERVGATLGAAEVLGCSVGPTDNATLEGMEWTIAHGALAVARCGAIVARPQESPVRVQLLLPENLLMLVRVDSLVDDLNDLYARLDPRELAGGYLTLVTGPSKTADIEQTLIKGAHGPRRYLVLPYRGT